MKLMPMVSALLAAAGAVVVSAGPASAESDLVEGVYNVILDGSQVAIWTISPICVPVVGDGRVPLELPVGCGLAVLSSIGDTGTFRLTGGRWSYSAFVQGAIKCPDGASFPVHQTYAFDDSLNGTQTLTYNHACGQQPGIVRHPFTLSPIGPLPHPDNRYPLNCQDNPQHLCS